jgi:DNA-binding HxlR family transcriptional regulator
MLRFGILTRTVFGEKPPVEVEYTLTPFGRRFLRVLDEIKRLQADVDGRSASTFVPGGEAAPRRGGTRRG